MGSRAGGLRLGTPDLPGHARLPGSPAGVASGSNPGVCGPRARKASRCARGRRAFSRMDRAAESCCPGCADGSLGTARTRSRRARSYRAGSRDRGDGGRGRPSRTPSSPKTGGPHHRDAGRAAGAAPRRAQPQALRGGPRRPRKHRDVPDIRSQTARDGSSPHP